ncbi:MAG: GatB/YqeY domain-containing protein [Candidatus Komeilibacteria bacterium]|jgi:uncharacterized protein|nr:GatB/YqeY domain-containing protein [Candidatus Komeilibacteria bacterium]MBT4447238.1 GatB/YqeY domain-containing protein [Candidatus Komeilibacteria bacterium]
MSLQQDIEKKLIVALKAKQEVEVSTLRMLKSALKNLAIDKKIDVLEDEDALSIVKQELKKRKDSMESFRTAGRDDLLAIEEAEAKILEEYMPAMLGEEELDKIVDDVISEGYDNFGLIMKEVMARSKGQADGKMVQEKVKQKMNL